MPRIYPQMLAPSAEYVRGRADGYDTMQASTEALYKQLDDAKAQASLLRQEAAYWRSERDRLSVLAAAAQARQVVNRVDAFQRGADAMRAASLQALSRLDLTPACETVATMHVLPPADL